MSLQAEQRQCERLKSHTGVLQNEVEGCRSRMAKMRKQQQEASNEGSSFFTAAQVTAHFVPAAEFHLLLLQCTAPGQL